MGNHREGQQSIQNLHWVLHGPTERCWETAACGQCSATTHYLLTGISSVPPCCLPSPHSTSLCSAQAAPPGNRQGNQGGARGRSCFVGDGCFQCSCSTEPALDLCLMKRGVYKYLVTSNQGRWSWQKKPPPASNCFCKPLTYRVLLRGCGCKVPLISRRENKRYFLHTSIMCSWAKKVWGTDRRVILGEKELLSPGLGRLSPPPPASQQSSRSERSTAPLTVTAVLWAVTLRGQGWFIKPESPAYSVCGTQVEIHTPQTPTTEPERWCRTLLLYWCLELFRQVKPERTSVRAPDLLEQTPGVLPFTHCFSQCAFTSWSFPVWWTAKMRYTQSNSSFLASGRR